MLRRDGFTPSAAAAIVALVAFVALSHTAAAFADPIAFLVAMKGKVDVAAAKGGAAQRAALGRALERGDRVSTGPASSATLFFSDGNVFELGEKSAITLAGKIGAKAGAAQAQLPAEVFTKVSKFITGGSRQTGIIKSSPMRGTSDEPPMLVSPRRTEVMDGTPAFAWREVAGATRYKVTISGENGEVWSRTVTTTTLDYPADAEALAADTDYLWEVQALSDRGPLRKEDTAFHVLASEETKTVSEELGKILEAAGGTGTEGGRYLAGSYLFGRGLLRDAADHFEALCRLAPDSPGPHEALGNVYRAMGLTDLAYAEVEKALNLTRTP